MDTQVATIVIIGGSSASVVVGGVTYYFGLWGDSIREWWAGSAGDIPNQNSAGDEEEKTGLLMKNNDNEDPRTSSQELSWE